MFKGIIDTTLRDGQQSPLLFDSYKYRFTLEEKKSLINGLVNLGIRHFEFFSPVVSEIEKKDFYEIKKYIQAKKIENIWLLAHCRCNSKDINEAINAGFDGVNLYMNGTRTAHKHSYGKSKADVVGHIVNTISRLRKKYPHFYIRFTIEDAFRTPLSDIYEIFDLIYPLVNTFGIPDTVGIATPEIVKKRVRGLKKRYPNVDFECHFHNDRGFALINTVTAIVEGVEFADASIWGLAERSGIASLTGVLLNLYQTNKKYTKDINLDLCYPLNVLMGSILNWQVPYNEPVSVTNRTHIAGVHHKAVLSQKKIYEAHNLDKFGVTNNQLLLGPLSGWNLIYYYLKEVAYFDISIDQAKQITKEFKNSAELINKKLRPENLLVEIAKKYNPSKINVNKKYLKWRIENFA